tara:strand:+ start:224 stop:523 length:300 start_codon:yes stop_codon:yes gene_type:complete
MAKTNQEITEALTVLTPTAKYTVSGTTIIWNDSDVSQPSDSAIDAEIAKQKSDYTAAAYQRNRKVEYPELAEQLDQIYHNGIDSWKAEIKKIKDKYPKP